MATIKETTLNAIERVIEPAIQDKGYELVHIELGRANSRLVVRLYIDKPEGITLLDCERVSKEVGPLLDSEDFFQGQYLLEVSSPGLERPIRREKDFQRFSGQKVSLEVKTPLAGRRRFKGTIQEVKEGKITLGLSKEKHITISLDNLKKANLVWDQKIPPTKR